MREISSPFLSMREWEPFSLTSTSWRTGTHHHLFHLKPWDSMRVPKGETHHNIHTIHPRFQLPRYSWWIPGTEPTTNTTWGVVWKGERTEPRWSTSIQLEHRITTSSIPRIRDRGSRLWWSILHHMGWWSWETQDVFTPPGFTILIVSWVEGEIPPLCHFS